MPGGAGGRAGWALSSLCWWEVPHHGWGCKVSFKALLSKPFYGSVPTVTLKFSSFYLNCLTSLLWRSGSPHWTTQWKHSMTPSRETTDDILLTCFINVSFVSARTKSFQQFWVLTEKVILVSPYSSLLRMHYCLFHDASVTQAMQNIGTQTNQSRAVHLELVLKNLLTEKWLKILFLYQ